MGAGLCGTTGQQTTRVLPGVTRSTQDCPGRAVPEYRALQCSHECIELAQAGHGDESEMLRATGAAAVIGPPLARYRNRLAHQKLGNGAIRTLSHYICTSPYPHPGLFTVTFIIPQSFAATSKACLHLEPRPFTNATYNDEYRELESLFTIVLIVVHLFINPLSIVRRASHLYGDPSSHPCVDHLLGLVH